MEIAQKKKIIQLLESGERVAVVAKRFVVNESTIRSILDNKPKILFRSLRFKHDSEVALQTYQELYQNTVRRKQTTLTDYFKTQ